MNGNVASGHPSTDNCRSLVNSLVSVDIHAFLWPSTSRTTVTVRQKISSTFKLIRSLKNGTGSTVDCIDHRHSLYIHPTQWRDQSYPRLQGALAFQEDRSRGRVRPSLGDPQNAPRRGRGGRVSYVIRRTRRGEAPWRGRRVESACSTGTSRRQLRFNNFGLHSWH